MGVFVAMSSVKDGSMHNRNDALHDVVLQNRQIWLSKQGIRPEDTTRLLIRFEGDDYCRYRQIGEPEKGVNMYDDDDFIADAIVTTTPGHALILPVADCIATTLYDPINGVLMMTHLGRQSLEQDGGVRSVEYLTAHYGTNPADIEVWSSPTIGKKEYKIYKLDNKGMKEVFFEQMDRAGVLRQNITDNDRDTGSDIDYFSYSEHLKGNKSVDGCHAMVAVMRP